MLIDNNLLVSDDAIRNMAIPERIDYSDRLCKNWKENFDKTPLLPNPPEGDRPKMLPPPPGGRMFVENKGGFVLNDDWASYMSQIYTMRVSWMQAMIDPRRNLDHECGYPPMIVPKQYRYMYDREGPGSRVVKVYPDECWAVNPDIYEIEDPTEKTPFEVAWMRLSQSSWINPLHYLHRVDVLSGIGRYGVLLIGTDDGADLSEPLPIIPTDVPTTANPPPYQILYMRPFDEMMAHIINYERDPMNPRFGHPVYYHIIFADIRVGEPGMTAASISVTSRVVHWTRVLHIADNRESSEVFGVPRMQAVFNRLCDVRKILGGSAEMLWKGGFPGYSFELNPDLVTAGVTLDMESIKKELEAYSNNLQRYLAIVGMNAKSLAPQAVSPEYHFLVQMQAIALSIGVPLRIFMGSEQAQLASGQDVRTWNRRLQMRQERYLSPWVIRPFIDRLIMYGVLPAPAEGSYKVRWPDINTPSDMEKAQIANYLGGAIMKYIIGGGYQVCNPTLFFHTICGMDEDISNHIVKQLQEKGPELVIKNPNEKIPGGDAGEDKPME